MEVKPLVEALALSFTNQDLRGCPLNVHLGLVLAAVSLMFCGLV